MQQPSINKYSLGAMLLLLIPALFYNLGIIGIQADEPTRANVAMEMMYSGNYLVSKIVGEYYYKKPPLFNWLLIFLYETTGSKSEFITRLAAVIPLLCFSFRIFRIVQKQLNWQTALLAAFISITFGRMLYYDAMLGHIDILYAWVTFESFYLLYVEFPKGRHFFMFLSFYALHAVGFMLKGLPSLAFPVFTLAAMALYQRQVKWLLTFKHVLGGIIAFIPVLVFFYFYSKDNSIWGWVYQLWDQSRQRTVLDKTLWESVSHLFTFPIDHIMHLAPWSLLVVFLFRNDAIKKIKQYPFLVYLFWVLLFNLPPYWASPGYYPRYLFMLYPIVFILLGHAFFERYFNNTLDRKYSDLVLKGIMVFTTVGFVGAIVYMNLSLLEWRFIVVLLLLLLCISWLFYDASQSVWWFISFLLVTRIAFNLYVLPYRASTGVVNSQKQQALEVHKLAAGKPLYLAPNSDLNHNYVYYIERERKEALLIRMPDTTNLFLFYPPSIPNAKFISMKRFSIDYEGRTLHLVKFTQLPNR
jgi:4-amino-4-deoxy-L-arabinose transferase-like glycosyltransferase